MQETFSAGKYYNVKLIFHSMTCTFSSFIYCDDILVCWLPTLSGLQSSIHEQEIQKLEIVAEVGLRAAAAAAEVDNGQGVGRGNQCKSLEIK